MSNRYNIAVVPGDGIGLEITPITESVVRAALEPSGGTIETVEFPFGAGHYKKHGAFMPPDGLDILRPFDAILFGAVGLPDVDDTLPAKNFTFKVRCGLRQYVNYRPCKRYAAPPGPLRSDADFDFVIIRENNEGEFVQSGSEHHLDSAEGFATQISVFTRKGITQVARYSFGLAQRRRGKLTNVTKSNTLIHSMIGDILSDLGGALVGSLGLAPSGNINPEREFPSMFEPIHGSAPDIAGQGIANPIGSIESGALMLEHLGEQDAAERIRSAVAAVLSQKIGTPDLGGTATTSQIGKAVIERL